jgi:hypothetical protein
MVMLIDEKIVGTLYVDLIFAAYFFVNQNSKEENV